MSRFINTELKSNSDSEKLMGKLECNSDPDSE